jgi:uroporphyrinogen-III synthase
MANELAGLHILNTRPAGQAEELSTLLREAGARVTELPLLVIEPLPLDAHARQTLLDLDRYDYCCFVSVNAARLGLEAVAGFWPQWPHRLPAIATGRSTAAVLDAAGLCVLCPGQEDSEGVLALPELADVAGKRFLLLRGEDGRELLADTLRARGARVDVLALYRRQLPAPSLAQWQALPPPAPDWVILSSPAAWRHWQQLAGAAATAVGLLVVSTRLQAQVQAAGARTVLLAGGAGSDAIKACLCRWRGAGEHDIQ